MPKPDITLEPTKQVVSQMAARIYAAYIARGAVQQGDEAKWMQRSIREAVRIARTVEASIESGEEPAAEDEGGSEPSVTAPGERTAPSPKGESQSPASQRAQQALEDLSFNDILDDIESGGS